MKAFVAALFGALTGLVVAGGVYLALRNRTRHRGLLEERRELQVEVARLANEAAQWKGMPEDAARLSAELDSLSAALLAAEPDLKERLGVRGSLSRPPRLVLGPPQEAGNWRVYPFSLGVEGRPTAVDSSLRALADDLPLVRFHRLDAVFKFNRLKLEITGSVRFPLTN